MLEPGDIVIDGGNSNWRVALEDAEGVKAKGNVVLAFQPDLTPLKN